MKISKYLVFAIMLFYSFNAIAKDKTNYDELLNKITKLENKIEQMEDRDYINKEVSPFMFNRFPSFDRVFEYQNRLFEDIFKEHKQSSFSINREKDKITIKAKMPNIKKDKIDIEVTNNIMTIKSIQQNEDKEGKVISSRYNSIYQQVSLPNNASIDKIDTSYKNEELIIKIPLKDQKTKKIKIK